MRRLQLSALLLGLAISPALAQSPAVALRGEVQQLAEKEYAYVEALYKELHAAPELSFQEEKSAARMATELRSLGWEVTEKVGGHGVVTVLKNGDGPTVLVRCDMDALPVREMTRLPYASKVTTKDENGVEVPVMHACGHDVHMASWVGTARVLTALKEKWKGTLVFIAQPAEERGAGAAAMLKDGLFTRFPKPDVCLALHVNSSFPSGVLGWREGPLTANVDSVDITVKGIGGHGAQPQTTKDPIVLAAQLVLALQTIDSRELHPTEAVVVTVGSIHGGTKNNIIPDSVKLQLTIRTFTDETRQKVIAAIKRIARGLGIAAGLPEGLMPEVTQSKTYTPVLNNDPEVTRRVVGVFREIFGEKRVRERKPTMGGEDFARYGRTEEKIPIFMFALGAMEPGRFSAAREAGDPLPSLHSGYFSPDLEPTLKTGMVATTAAVLEMLSKQR